MKILIIKYRIYLIFIFFFKLSFAQSPEELKRFMETYDKIKVDQQANEIVKKGIESEKNPSDRPVKLLVTPSDINKYYREKMNVLKSEVKELNNWYEQWSKGGATPNFRVENPEIYIKNLNWVSNWIDIYFFNKVSDFLLGLLVMIIITFVVFKSKKKKNN